VRRERRCYCCVRSRNFEFGNEKGPQKKSHWVRPSRIAKEKHGGNDLMTRFKRDDIGLSGELTYMSIYNLQIKILIYK